MKKDGGPAFPTTPAKMLGSGEPVDCGMSLRDYFAAAALQGYWAQPDEALPPNITHAEHMAKMARVFYEYADSMILERDK